MPVKPFRPRNTQLLARAQENFNKPVIAFLEVVRLIGYAEDADDCYFIMAHADKEKPVRWHSAVMGFMPLNTLIGQGVNGNFDNYKRLDQWLSLNGAPKRDAFLIDIESPDGDKGNEVGNG